MNAKIGLLVLGFVLAACGGRQVDQEDPPPRAQSVDLTRFSKERATLPEEQAKRFEGIEESREPTECERDPVHCTLEVAGAMIALDSQAEFVALKVTGFVPGGISRLPGSAAWKIDFEGDRLFITSSRGVLSLSPAEIGALPTCLFITEGGKRWERMICPGSFLALRVDSFGAGGVTRLPGSASWPVDVEPLRWIHVVLPGNAESVIVPGEFRLPACVLMDEHGERRRVACPEEDVPLFE